MSDRDLPHEFFSLPPRDFLSEDEIPTSTHSTLDTLFSTFALRNRSASPITPSPQFTPDRVRRTMIPTKKSVIDLRSLDYTSDYDSHLMCPICHVPFIKPVVLDCDHTFCSSCFEEYATGAASSERSQCPSCRTSVLSTPKKASRLISNMCNDIKVRCPNSQCTMSLARACIATHVERECPEQPLTCPSPTCDKQTKRKNYVPHQCTHNSHIECECGKIIELGRGEWLKHKDKDCPSTMVTCKRCGDRIPAHDDASNDRHECHPEITKSTCPGEEFGCRIDCGMKGMESHIKSCPIAQLAPYLTRQNRLLRILEDRTSQAGTRNETLELGLERIDELLSSHIQPQLDRIQLYQQDHDHDVEEIERDHIPSAAAVHHRDLLLPAHIRDLTPSPTMSHGQFQQSPQLISSHQHLLSLHESLRQNVNGLEQDIMNLNNTITELDARTSMQLMNETLRLKEELAHVNAALFSTRSQVQWLLNRERMNMGMMRGRPPMVPSSTQQPLQTQSQSAPEQSQQNPVSDSSSIQPQAADFTSYPFGNTSSAQSSTATSPMFGAINMSETRRPSIRRHSGGSQERVKL